MSRTHLAAVWPFLIVIGTQTLFAGFSVHILSAIRASITTENLWLQGEQAAVEHLKFYLGTGHTNRFLSYKSSMTVPLAFDRVERALEAGNSRDATALLEDAGVPAVDASEVVWLFSDFGRFSYIADAIEQWRAANAVVLKIDRLAQDIHAALSSEASGATSPTEWLPQIEALDDETVPIVATYAASMGAGARVIEWVLIVVNLALAIGLAALTVWRVRRYLVQRKDIESALSWQAGHDPLTGVCNRRAMKARLDDVTGTHRVDRNPHALMFIDLDQFKIVNDTCGHAVGDDLLRRVCVALQQSLHEGDLLARLGGDEFSVLLRNCSLERAQGVAEAVRIVVRDIDFLWEQRVFRISASIGLVHTDQGLATTEELMRAADMACFMAKQKGRDRVHLHRADDQDLMRHAGEMNWVQRIHQALEDNRFCLYAQEIAPLGEHREDGLHVELLIRLRDETGTLVPPAAFLPAAERFGLMNLIDRWVVRAAFRILADRLADPQAEAIACCAINLSGTTVGDEAFLAFLDTSFTEFAIPPEIICFEITETNAITHLDAATAFVLALQRRGCRFSLDDFGSGMSSFGYLKHLPVDFLKIDGCFVKNLLNDQVDRAMVEAINHIGHVMGKRIIAEFVETEGLRTALGRIGVDYGQGYGIARPKPFDPGFRSAQDLDTPALRTVA